jgi:hypothetical protein
MREEEQKQMQDSLVARSDVSNFTTLVEFESFHRARQQPKQERPTVRELLLTGLLTIVMAPFSFVTFMVIPVMGQITVGFALLLTAIYLCCRKSILVALTAGLGVLAFWSVLFETIQVIKTNLEVPLFFFTATGIPVSAIYCIFIGTRIWTIRGGAED